MFIVNFLFALAVALLITMILSVRYRRLGPWSRIEAFFAILFFATWAIGVWITPFGPLLFGVYWLPFFLAGLIISLLLASVPPRVPRTKKEAIRQAEEEMGVEKTIDAFFWMLLFLFIIMIAGWYIWPKHVY